MDLFPRTPEQELTPEYDIPEVLVLDFDRMLGDVDLCMEHFYTAAERYNVDTAPVRDARQQTEGRKTFEPLSYIKEQLSEEDYMSFAYAFVTFHRLVPLGGGNGPLWSSRFESVLYPDAQRFLQRLAHADVPHIVMTYGENAEWQQLKLMAAGYPMGCTITDTPDKGAALQSLRGRDGQFHMYVAKHGDAVYHASRLTFIDDKAPAFANLPEEAAYAGYWLQRGVLLDHQKGEVGANVTPIASLDDLQISSDGQIYLGRLPEAEPYPSRESRRRTPSRYDVLSGVHARYGVYLPLHPDIKIVEHPAYTPDFIASAPVVQFQNINKAT